MAHRVYMDKEVKDGLHGVNGSPAMGHWTLLRWYHIGEYSKYWDVQQKEAIAGPKWKYSDYPMRTTYNVGASIPSSLTTSISGGETSVPGFIEMDWRVYIVERCYRPKEGDHILEYSCDYPDDKDEFVSFARTARPTKHVIVNAFPIRSDNSRIVYYLARTKLDQENR